MRPLVHEAQEFLNANQALLDEMNRYDEKRKQSPEEITDNEEKILNQYHRLKTFILEKKMGLLNDNE